MDINSGHGMILCILNRSLLSLVLATAIKEYFFDKTHGLVIVTTAGNYNKWNIEKDTYALIRDYVYPAIKQ